MRFPIDLVLSLDPFPGDYLLILSTCKNEVHFIDLIKLTTGETDLKLVHAF